MNFDFIMGMNYGDEGKGRIAAFVANQYSPEDTVSVLASGGAQRGHTYVNSKNIRHIFRHFGCATLDGYANYIHSTFITNPIIFRQEYQELEAIGITPTVFINKRTRITFPFHMFVNQFEEEFYRLLKRHGINYVSGGSCGMGIYYSVVLQDMANTQFNVIRNDIDLVRTMDKFNKSAFDDVIKRYVLSRFIDIVELIGDEYYELYNKYVAYVNDDNIKQSFIDDVDFLKHNTICIDSIRDLHNRYAFNNFVVELSQGAYLDESISLDYNTPCRTIAQSYLSNILLDDTIVNVTYHFVTRWYVTRHGYDLIYSDRQYTTADPRTDIFNNTKMYDNTNVANIWQGTLQYHPISFAFIRNIIRRCARRPSNTNFKYKLYVTCLDQIENNSVPVYDSNRHCINHFTASDFIYHIYDFVGSALYLCFSESNDDIINITGHPHRSVARFYYHSKSNPISSSISDSENRFRRYTCHNGSYRFVNASTSNTPCMNTFYNTSNPVSSFAF